MPFCLIANKLIINSVNSQYCIYHIISNTIAFMNFPITATLKYNNNKLSNGNGFIRSSSTRNRKDAALSSSSKSSGQDTSNKTGGPIRFSSATGVDSCQTKHDILSTSSVKPPTSPIHITSHPSKATSKMGSIVISRYYIDFKISILFLYVNIHALMC